MTRTIYCLAVLIVLIVLGGCRTMAPAPVAKEKGESLQEAQEAFKAVAGAVAGKELTGDELKGLAQQLRTDEEAQSAIEAITGSVGGGTPIIKYCPITGERYAPHLEKCPVHGVPLKVVEP